MQLQLARGILGQGHRALVSRTIAMGCGASKDASTPAAPRPLTLRDESEETPIPGTTPKAASEDNAQGIERNAGGSEEPHSGDPELWNIDGTEMDMNAKYKVGGQMWYLQSRAKDAVKAGKPIPGVPFNEKATAAGRLFSDD